MKRLVPALAAVVLGSGCIVTTEPCDRTITTDWINFTYWSGSAWVSGGCASAGVDSVDVWMGTGHVGNFLCSDGGVIITGVAEGTHEITVEGLDAAGFILYRDIFSVSASACGDSYMPAYPSEGFMNLDYSAPGCISSPCFLWLSVQDDIANYTAVVHSASNDPERFQYPSDVVLRLPVGTYSLNWMQLVSWSYQQEARACVLPTFQVGAARSDVLIPPVSLTAACP